MISIVLQKNLSEENKLDKTLTTVSTQNVNLKDTTNILNPTFILSLSTLPDFNYITATALKRSYFVKNIVFSGGVWEVSCECDVLSTYKAEIRANKAIIKRQENEWNLFYNDGSFRTYQNPHIVTKSFPSGFDTSTNSFILAVAGGAEDIPT